MHILRLAKAQANAIRIADKGRRVVSNTLYLGEDNR